MNVTIATEDSCIVYYTQSLEYSTLPRAGDIIWIPGETISHFKVLHVSWYFTTKNQFDVEARGVEVVVERVVKKKTKRPWWKVWP